MKLNRTPNPLDRDARNGENDNWDIIEGEVRAVGDKVDNFVEEVSDAALDKVVDNAKLNWKEPVDSFSDLPSSAEEGDTRMDKSTGKVYRYDGTNWVEIQQIDAGPVNELDSRLSSQLAHNANLTFDVDEFRGKESLINRKKQIPCISYVDDDLGAGFFTKLMPLAEEYDIIFTSAVITNNPHGFPDDDRNWNPDHQAKYGQYEDMVYWQNKGRAEFISHTHTHDVNNRYEDMTEEEQLEDMRKSRDILKKWGFNYRGIAYAFGSYTDEVVKRTRQVFDYAIGTGTRGASVVKPPFTNYDMRRTQAQNNLSEIKQQIDIAAAENGWLILSGHVDQYDWYSEEYMREIIEYALSKGLKFVSTEEGYARHGNLAEYGNNVITAGGVSYGDSGIGEYLGFNALGPNDPPPHFSTTSRRGVKVYYTIINSQGNEGFYNDSSGMLITYALGVGFVFQEYHIYRSSTVVKRHWINDESGWSEWFITQSVVRARRLGPNIVSSSRTASAFETGITLTRITSQGNREGFPEGASGFLITFRETEAGFSYQEYKIYNTERKYTRYEKSNGEWSEWLMDSAGIVLSVNSISSGQLASEYPVGDSHLYISGGGDRSDLPKNINGGEQSGTLTTIKPSIKTGRTHQEFKVYNRFDKYLRYEKQDGTWSEWRKYALETI